MFNQSSPLPDLCCNLETSSLIIGFDSKIVDDEKGIVSPLDEIKNLLDGRVDPENLEDDPELYEMAESIYGRDALEQMGVEAPERPSESITQPNGDAKHEVQMPANPISAPQPITETEGSINKLVFFLTLFLTSLILTNISIGFGSVLPLCDSPDSETSCEDKLVLSEITNYQSPDSWTEPPQLDLVDGMLLVILTILMVFALRKK